MLPGKPSTTLTYFDQQARFEAMRRHARKGDILQKHEDLRREYERLIRVYEREAKYVTSRLALSRSEYMDKMKALETFNGDSPSLTRAAGKTDGVLSGKFHKKLRINEVNEQRPSHNILLFRVEKRDGQKVYIKMDEQSRKTSDY